jgi:hypothetical protein
MSKAIRYNGHKSWNQWNVSLWIGNEEHIYDFAVECAEAGARRAAKWRTGENKHRVALDTATSMFMRVYGYERTCDGAVFNRLSVKRALEGYVDEALGLVA